VFLLLTHMLSETICTYLHLEIADYDDGSQLISQLFAPLKRLYFPFNLHLTRSKYVHVEKNSYMYMPLVCVYFLFTYLYSD